MTKEELVDFLKENLTIEVDYSVARAYWERTELKISLVIEGEKFCTSTAYFYE